MRLLRLVLGVAALFASNVSPWDSHGRHHHGTVVHAATRDTVVAGVEGDVNHVATTARNNFGFTFVVSDYNPNDFIQGIGTNHIARNATFTYTDGMGSYRADGAGGQQLILTVVAEIIDARGNHSNISTDVRVTAVR